MNYSTFREAMEQMEWEQQIDVLSVYRAFEHIQDGRHKRGVRYSVTLLSTLIRLGKLAGMTMLLGIAEGVRPGLGSPADQADYKVSRIGRITFRA